MVPHNSDVLKKLFPLRIGGDLDSEFEIVGSRLDNIELDIELLARAMVLDPRLNDDAVYLLDDALRDWETVYEIGVPEDATPLERRDVVVGKFRSTGGVSKAHFENIASGLGYKIGTHAAVGDPHLRILRGEFLPFRADYSLTDHDLLYDQTSGFSAYTVRVLGTGVESDATLKSIFNDLCPPMGEFVFVNE